MLEWRGIPTSTAHVLVEVVAGAGVVGVVWVWGCVAGWGDTAGLQRGCRVAGESRAGEVA